MSVITYTSFDNLPVRNDYLHADQINAVNTLLESNKPILFLPTYLAEDELIDAKYEKAKYKIILNGILSDGRNVSVVIDDIDPYFEVHLRSKEKPNARQEAKEIQAILKRNEIEVKNTSIIYGKPFKGFQYEQSLFVRFYFTKIKVRKAAIELLRKARYETTHDDLTNYFRVVCRDYQTSFSSWIELTNYQLCEVPTLKGLLDLDNCSIRVNMANYKKYTKPLTNDLIKDKSISLCWDIETCSPNGAMPTPDDPTHKIICISATCQFINAKEPFVQICFTEFPSDPRPNTITVVCGCERNIIHAFGRFVERIRPQYIFGFNDSDYDWPWLIKRASQTKGLLIKLANWFSLSIQKSWQQHTDESVLKYHYSKQEIKLEAGKNAISYCLAMFGYIPADVRTIFRKLHPTDEASSLKHFLERNKLSGKEHMPIPTMFKICNDFRALSESPLVKWDKTGASLDFVFTDDQADDEQVKYKELKDSFANVNYYCIIDAKRCHDLMYIRAVVLDHREVADLTYCSMFDAFYRADGMKVRNTTIGIGQGAPFNIRFSNITNTSFIDGKYPGAFVVPPKKGLQTSKLSFTERILKAKTSNKHKHPKYQQWLTIPDDTIVLGHKIIKEHGIYLTDEQIQSLEQHSKLPQVLKEFFTERTGRPIGGLDFSSLYPSIVRALNLSPEYCIYDKSIADEFIANGQHLTETNVNFNGRMHTAWFVWHNNQYDIHLTDEKGQTIIGPDGKPVINEKFQFGVYPYILNDLFNRRKILKKQLLALNDRKEKFNHDEQKYKDTHTASEYKLYVEQHAEEYEDIIFQIKYIDCKQNAVKRFMNTFYGESGNKLSPFFILELAGGITSHGVKTLQLAYKTVTDAGCTVYYGDTDSLYTSMPEEKFKEIDRAYYTGEIDKLTYWTKLVEISFSEVKPLIAHINSVFKKSSNTDFLTMAYEEFMFPLAFTAKKKYFGIEHKHLINFTPKELFIRGLEVKKRGVSNFLKIIFMEILWKCMAIDNIDDLLEIVQNKIDEIYSKEWSFDDFIQTDEYRPKKQNIKVQTFVKRMRERGIIVKENERFKYVVVKKYPYAYDTRGRKVPLSIGDKIELVEVAQEEKLLIDIDHYMSGSVNGQLARLVTYHDMFYIEPRDHTDTELKIAEDTIYKNACKFIDDYCSRYYAQYNTFGKTYQKIFRTANKAIINTINKYDPLVGSLLGANVDLKKFEDWFIEVINKKVDKSTETYGYTFVRSQLDILESVEERTKRINILYIAYNRILQTRQKQYAETMSILRRRIRENLSDINKLYLQYNKSINYIVSNVKEQLNIDEDTMQPTDEPGEYIFDKIDDDLITKRTINESKIDALFSEKNTDIITAFKTLYIDIHTITTSLKQTESIFNDLKTRHHKKEKIVIAPPPDVLRSSIVNDVAEAIKNAKSIY
jgi:DNA polymerase elongation subunit (family B)